ncbi:MAG: helix-turn-helix domain-containing protein [Clostridia bacterium]|nr:helix-turn-helix domain-containing protein [Clostridia bacterium]
MNNLNRQLLFASKQNYHIYIGERYTGKVDAHYHSFYHCTLLLKGDLAYFQQDQMLRMQPGDLLFTPIYCNHSLYIFPPETSYFCLSFSQEMMDALVSCFPKLKKDFSNLPPIIHMPRHERERLVHLLYCLMDEQNTSADSPFQIGNMLVISALQLMVRDVYTTQLLDRKQPSESNYSAVISCIRYIEQHLSDSIGTEDLVKVAALSQSSLYNAFKLHTGMPIRQYITERRIQQSLRLLRDGRSITDAAAAVGFQDFSTYYRNFVKCMGVSPSEVAKRLNRAHSKSGSEVPGHLNACIGCILCSAACKQQAISLVNTYPVVDLNKCTRCGECIGICICGCTPVDPALLSPAPKPPAEG